MPTKPQKFKAPRGMSDITPSDQPYWQHFHNVANKIAEIFGYQQIDTPIIENINLFKRSLGKGTDIIDKEMFKIVERGKEQLVLRPEGTACIARAYIEHGMSHLPQPVKLYSTVSLFRYERPQKGRYRQHHQFDVEVLGSRQPVVDAQVIVLAWQILDRLKLGEDLIINLNSIGCPDCRPDFTDVLLDYYRRKTRHLCRDCKVRYKKNPLRLLDCKKEKCQRLAAGAPQSVDYLCGECKEHLQEVLEYLDEMDLPYNLDHRLVRGLDYYTKTVFEITNSEDSSFAYCGGGRYDGLVELLGGRSTPGVGFGMGVERIIDLLKEKKIKSPNPRLGQPDVFLSQLGEAGKRKAFKLFIDLLESGITVHESFARNSLKSQLSKANKLAVKQILIMGQKEALEDSVLLRDMESGVQETVPLDKIVEILRNRLKKR